VSDIPAPFPISARVIVNGVTVVIVDRAPNAEGWRYIGTRADLAGHQIHFSHHEATPVHPLRDILSRAGLNPDVYEREIVRIKAENTEPVRTPLQELLAVVEEVARHGLNPDIRAAWRIFKEETA
jgi:hypothetical protein